MNADLVYLDIKTSSQTHLQLEIVFNRNLHVVHMLLGYKRGVVFKANATRLFNTSKNWIKMLIGKLF